MFWLRALFYAAPLAVVFCAVLLYRQVSRFEMAPSGGAMNCVIREDIGPLNPMLPLSGVTREVRDLLFEPLLLRDDDLKLKPNIITAWERRTHVTIRCASEENAGDAEAKLLSGEYVGEGIELLEVERNGSVITVVISGHERDVDQRLVDGFERENLGNFLMIRVELDHSIQDSIETFLKGSVEKSQIKMLEYEGDRIANLFVEGDVDLLLREMELYYDSNRGLNPSIEEVGIRSHTSFKEAAMDIRRDVVWHDGRRLTARDILFSYGLLTKFDSPLSLRESFWFVEKIEAVDDYRIKMICQDSPTIMMESWEKLPVLPEHILGDAESPEIWADYFDMPVGNGPYQLVERRSDGGVRLAAVPNFFRGAPVQKQVVYRKVSSLESTLLALRSGQIDTIEPDQRFSDWVDRNQGHIRRLRCLPRFQHFVAWNLDREPFTAREMRVAMSQSVDVDSILRDSSTEFQTRTRSLFFPAMPYAEREMPLPLYDPKDAERAMERRGYMYDETKGIRLNPEGEPFSFALLVNETNAMHLELASILSDKWSAVGVQVLVEAVPWEELVASHLATRDFDAALLSWEVPLERDRYTSWHSEEAIAGGGNLWGLDSGVVDDLVEDLRYAEELEEVQALSSGLETEIAALQPCLFICDTGRIIWHREGAIKVARPDERGHYKLSQMTIGKSGLERVRPWWVDSRLEVEQP